MQSEEIVALSLRCCTVQKLEAICIKKKGPTLITHHEQPQTFTAESCLISNPVCWLEIKAKTTGNVTVQILMDCVAHFPKIHPDIFISFVNFGCPLEFKTSHILLFYKKNKIKNQVNTVP